MYKFSPSLMCMDLTRFKEQILFLNTVADYFHIDIMDGHFVPNITLSPFFISELKKLSAKPIDSHLMVQNPQEIMNACINAGSDFISLHPETIGAKAFRLIDELKKRNIKVGLVFNPEVSVQHAEYYLEFADKITVMTVDPGFAGQPFIAQMLKKIENIREIREKNGYGYAVEIDGSCNRRTFADLVKAGGEIFVVGTSGLFGLDPDIKTAWEKMLFLFNEAVL
ncbi:ribulose-phosphate 3-epimerase [Treponema sp. OMZ 840]|uniref:D-allulose 6-phosphate 3-epimerase n=1 Tax=Treponema sp. OMZ 840 TaxID=244313 RepID=UPI003D8F96E0